MSRKPEENVEYFRHAGDRKELERLARLTGLLFESVPESLLRATPAIKATGGEAAGSEKATGTDKKSSRTRPPRI